jgi:hypothetical protein
VVKFALIAIGLLAAPATLLAGGASAAPGGGGVLVIGDSLGVGGEAYVNQALDGLAVTTDAKIGRGSAACLDVLGARMSDEYGVVVFALGSNDDPANPSALAANLEQANALAGGRCVVVATVEVEQYSGVEDDPLNEVIRAFAAANPNVRLVEWERAVTRRPDLLFDGAHATAEGYALRAALIAEAIASCDSSTASGAGIRAAQPSPGLGDGIPKPDRDALAEGESAPDFDQPEPEPQAEPEPEPITHEQAFRILADAVSSQIAIGAL